MTEDQRPKAVRGGAGIAVAMAVMNIGTYGFTMVSARLLGPQAYGGFAALMNVLLVVSVASLGLQATAARRISADPAHVAQIERAVIGVTYRAAFALGLLLLVLTPVIDRVVRMDDLLASALIAVSAVPLTLMGGLAGILQGERRWTALGWVYVGAGVPRLVLGVALLLWQPDPTWAMVAVAVGCVFPVVIGHWSLRGARASGSVSTDHRGRYILAESVHNSQALFAFFALSNVDIIVARNVLSDHEAGLYAAGLILTKAMLFLPQFVVVLAFPSMSTAHERRVALTRSIGAIALLGLLGTAAAWLLSGLAMVFIGGPQFAEIESRLWLFAVLGTAVSMLQLLVYSVLARQGRLSILLVWVALLAVVGLGWATDTIVALASTVLAVETALLAVLLVIAFRATGKPVPADQTPVP